jgi:CRP/FNR family cyclic AMP-dependent transcriptional regulator
MDITTLVQAVQSAKASDAFDADLDAQQWQALLPYLSRRNLRAGAPLMRQGEPARSACWLEQGNLQIYVSRAASGSSPVGVLRPGALVGEAGLFAEVPRAANVEAMTPSVVYRGHGCTPTACSACTSAPSVWPRPRHAGRRPRAASRCALQARLLQFVGGVVVGAVEVAAQQAVARIARVARDADHPRIGTPTSASAWLASIRLPSMASGTTSVAPAARSRSRSVSSMVRTITGTLGACSRTRRRIFSADGVSW